MFFLALLVRRIIRAIQVLWTLVTDWETTRRLPWPYLRSRAVRSPVMLLQLGGLVVTLIVYPASFLTSGLTRELLAAVGATVWLAAVSIPWIVRRIQAP